MTRIAARNGNSSEGAQVRQREAQGSPRPPRSGRSAESWEARALTRLLRACGDPPISVVLPDGQELEPAGGESLGRLRIADRKTLWRLAANPLYQFGEAYADGRLEVEGDLGEVLTMIFRRWNAAASGKPVIRPWLRLRWLRKNSPARSRDNIHHHYDIGNDFYELWLDQQLVYTCAYFPTPEVTLEAAQIAKLDHVCKKLRLEPGEHVVEAGCGWGALALHMARHYGVKVTAFNISREQVAYARQRAEREGLSGRVEFVLDDWRSIRQPCDAFVSVGMLEHVGLSNYQQLGAAIGRCLTPSGRGLIHSIGQNQPMPMNPWIERRIFPGAYPPTLRQCMDVLEPHSFTVLDVENLRLHYALTLRHWLARFELASETVKQRFGEKFVRTWWMYLAGSMAAFESGTLQLFQITFARGDCNRVPWTRAELYAQPGASPPGQWAGNK